MGEPEVLMTEVLPSFAKISTILDYVNTNRNIDLKTKYQDKERKKMVESINILKDCQSKLSKVIIMRNQDYP
jgi:iron uptake system EfeUOB component EfeO/EfeM